MSFQGVYVERACTNMFVTFFPLQPIDLTFRCTRFWTCCDYDTSVQSRAGKVFDTNLPLICSSIRELIVRGEEDNESWRDGVIPSHARVPVIQTHLLAPRQQTSTPGLSYPHHQPRIQGNHPRRQTGSWGSKKESGPSPEDPVESVPCVWRADQSSQASARVLRGGLFKFANDVFRHTAKSSRAVFHPQQAYKPENYPEFEALHDSSRKHPPSQEHMRVYSTAGGGFRTRIATRAEGQRISSSPIPAYRLSRMKLALVTCSRTLSSLQNTEWARAKERAQLDARLERIRRATQLFLPCLRTLFLLHCTEVCSKTPHSPSPRAQSRVLSLSRSASKTSDCHWGLSGCVACPSTRGTANALLHFILKTPL